MLVRQLLLLRRSAPGASALCPLLTAGRCAGRHLPADAVQPRAAAAASGSLSRRCMRNARQPRRNAMLCDRCLTANARTLITSPWGGCQRPGHSTLHASNGMQVRRARAAASSHRQRRASAPARRPAPRPAATAPAPTPPKPRCSFAAGRGSPALACPAALRAFRLSSRDIGCRARSRTTCVASQAVPRGPAAQRICSRSGVSQVPGIACIAAASARAL